MPVSLAKNLDICSNCGRDCAPTPSIELDPLCSACIADFRARDINLPIDTLHDLAPILADHITDYLR